MSQTSRLSLVGVSAVAFYGIVSYLLSPQARTAGGVASASIAGVLLLAMLIYLVSRHRI